MKYKMNEPVQTPNGFGRVISMPIGKSEYYTVLHTTGQAGLYLASTLKPILPSGEIPQIDQQVNQ